MRRALKIAPLAALALASTSVARAGSPSAADTEPEQQILTTATERRFSLMIQPDYDSVSSGGNSLTGVGVGLGFRYAFSEKWGLGGQIRQSFGLSAGGALFTDINASVAYALTGTLLTHHRTVSLDGRAVYEAEEYNPGGFRLNFLVIQYLFSSSIVVVPFSGFGGQLIYEFGSHSALNFYAGARLDMVTNGITFLYPNALTAGATVRF